MAPPSSHCSLFRLSRLLAISVALLSFGSVLGSCYTSIFSFGDSLTDTGNILYCHNSVAGNVLQPPYGTTYFHHPTGRCSDGRLIVDFIAEKLGLPFLPPYLGPDRDFSKGVNFAVAGATALDLSFWEERGVFNAATNISLGIQLKWFKQLLPSLCSSPSDCRDFHRTSLFLVGEIGANDFSYLFLQKRSLAEIQTFAQPVIDAIASAINMVIEYGARTLLVPGDLPNGCLAAYRTIYKSPNKEDYDPQTGCLNRLNELTEKYNGLLKRKLDELRDLHPDVIILYGDYYNAAMPLFQSPHKYGFVNGALIACCGGGGPYNWNSSALCGSGLDQVCGNPSTYVSWDGLHLTEAAYRFMADRLMEGLHFTHPITNPSSWSSTAKGLSNGTLIACCGGGGPYNWNYSAPCGSGLDKVCGNPSSYFTWEGLHLTEEAYRFMADRWMEGLHFTHPITNPSSWSSTAKGSQSFVSHKISCGDGFYALNKDNSQTEYASLVARFQNWNESL